MSFRELEYVLAIERYRNISKAAESLYLSQPTLSKFLHTCEESLGVRLFERNGNRYLLTHAGERYVDYARRILRIQADMDNELAEFASKACGRLALGYQFNRSSYMVPMTMLKFKALYPNAAITLQEDSSENLERMLLDGTVDLVIFNYTSRHPQLQYEVLSEEEILLMVPENHPLAGHGETLPDLRYPCFLNMNHSSFNRATKPPDALRANSLQKPGLSRRLQCRHAASKAHCTLWKMSLVAALS